MPKTRNRAKPQLAEFCPECRKQRIFAVKSILRLAQENPPVKYVFCQCQVCKKPALFGGNAGGDLETNSLYRVYPRPGRETTFFLPESVRVSYADAVGSEAAENWIACAVMAGVTLEAVCKQFAPEAKTAFDGLRAMQAKGIISDEILKWGEELRILRNVGVHAEKKKIDKLDATGAMDFLQAILEILFDLRPRFERFTKRAKAGGS